MIQEPQCRVQESGYVHHIPNCGVDHPIIYVVQTCVVRIKCKDLY